MKRWKLVTLLVLFFFAGAAAGSLATGWLVKERVARFLRGGSIIPKEVVTDRLGARLHLSAAEKEKAAVIIGAAMDELTQLRRANQPKIAAIVDRAVADLKEILSPEQQQKLDDLLHRVRKWREEGE